MFLVCVNILLFVKFIVKILECFFYLLDFDIGLRYMFVKLGVYMYFFKNFERKN